MKIVGPSGIGDISWMISKLIHVKDEIEEIRILDGAPRRTAPYVELAGFNSGYVTGLEYPTICRFEAIHEIDTYHDPTWERIRSIGADSILLECNQHLEAGRRLEKWLEDLPPPEYHYPLHTTDEHRRKALRYLGETDETKLRLSVSCASYQGSAAWHTWEAGEWCDFLRRVIDMGWQPVLAGGGWDDLTMTVADELEVPCFVGRTHIGTCIEILRHLDSYIGFSSGLNVIRTVLDKPAMAFWPHHQQDLMNSWVPPHMLDSRRYVGRPWQAVDEIWPTAKRFLERSAEEVQHEGAQAPAAQVHGDGAQKEEAPAVEGKEGEVTCRGNGSAV